MKHETSEQFQKRITLLRDAPERDDPPLPELTPELLRKIGEALGGRHWQSDVAREAQRSKSQITRYLNEERVPTISFGCALDRIMVDKIEDVTNFIGNAASPNKGKPVISEAVVLLRKAIKLLRKTSPAVPRITIQETSTRKRPPGKKKQRRSKRVVA